jgi:uncharacterized surface protein with fasciclin (FAS1) repeats
MRTLRTNRRWTRLALVACGTAALGITSTALLAGNGSQHKPPTSYARDGMMKQGDIIDTATGPGMQKVTTVVTAIKAADLVEALKGPGPFTVFAPTNDAFDKLPAGTVDSLLKPENKEKLKTILLYHVHAGDAIKAADVKTMSLTTLNGKPLTVKTDANGGVWINDAKVIKTDVVCSNGVIHWVDGVLMP